MYTNQSKNNTAKQNFADSLGGFIMIADTLERYRRYTGEETFSRIRRFDTLAQMWEARSAEYAELIAIEDDGKRYGVAFAGFDVRFVVEGNVLRVAEVVRL